MSYHGAVYEFLKDQGSIIAGLLALLAGWLAYRAGNLQATRTREQVDYMKSAAAENDRRVLENQIASCDREMARIAMLATIGFEASQQHQELIHSTVPHVFAPAFSITWIDVEMPGGSTLIPTDIRLAVVLLRGEVGRLNALINIKAPLGTLQWSELIEALQLVRNRADELQTALLKAVM